MARFGAYEVLHELKHGGMGSVLLGRKRGPGAFEQLVAIKTIRPEYASTDAVRRMFLDEAKILGGLTHPNIATVHDFGETPPIAGETAGTLYMVMEYVAGISFRNVLEIGMPPAVAARAIAEACRGLHAAHEVRDSQGRLLDVVHRDISPDNLLLGFDGHVKVIDFGIALVKNRQAPVTEFGTVKGKPPYMSPEQVKNEALDRRSDVFSLAVVLHEMLTGELLFDGENIYAVARAVEHKEIQPPSVVLGTSLPVGLDAAVMSALDRDLTRRTRSAAAFAEQLEQVIAAAGDETLEAWSERVLADARDQHRTWLAGIVAGHDVPVTSRGRATGSVTALGPVALVDQLPAAPIEAAPGPRSSDVSAPRDGSTGLAIATGDQPLPAPSRRRALAILLLVLALATGVVLLFVLSRSRSSGVLDAAVPIADAGSVDLARDALVSDVAADVAADLAIDAPPDTNADAAAPVADARVVAHDAGRIAVVPIDAPALPPVDATVAVGTGKLTVRHHPSSPSYLDVFVDGKPFGKTPIVVPKPLAAGHHLISLAKPDTGEVVYKTDVTIEDGKTTAVSQPAP